MSKYETRAKELCSTLFEGEDCTWEEDSIENDFLKLMLQLAEEVAFYSVAEGMDMVFKQSYTKQQVEELLQKQRELCTEEAKFYGKNIDAPNLNEWELNNLLEEESYDITILIDTYSILNAKHKID